MREGEYRNTALEENDISEADSNEIHNLRKLAREDSVYMLGAQKESFISQ